MYLRAALSIAALTLALSGCARDLPPADEPAPATADPGTRQAAPAPPSAPDPAGAEPTDVEPADVEPVDHRDGWRAVAWPMDREQLEDIVARAAAFPDRSEAAATSRALLERAGRPQPLGEVVGAWRVRSIQVHDTFGYAYPWFAADIAADADGALRFAKTTGSQRRAGRLFPDEDGRTLVFLGGSTVNDDPQRMYSRLAGTSLPLEHDSIGRLVRIGPDELLMVLDADDRGFELYHLRR